MGGGGWGGGGFFRGGSVIFFCESRSPATRPEFKMQEPPMAKQPLERFIPFANVEVAVPVILSARACSPPARVEVAVVDVAVKYANVGPDVAVSAVAEVNAASIPAVPPVTPLPLPPTQVPFMLTHPAVSWIPFANVEDALVDVMLRAVV